MIDYYVSAHDKDGVQFGSFTVKGENMGEALAKAAKNIEVQLRPDVAEMRVRLMTLARADASAKATPPAELTAVQKRLRRAAQKIRNDEAKRRYAAGERPGASTGIDDSLTLGYGTLDEHGFWQFPLYADDLREDDKLKELFKSQGNTEQNS